MKKICLTLSFILYHFFSLAQLSVTDLKVENRTNPIGLDTRSVQFSWVLISGNRNVMQTAFEIQVRENNALVWASKIVTETSVHIPYQGQPLQSGKRYEWKVRVWDNKGNRSPWSEPGYWQMAMLDPATEFSANWISSGLRSDTAFGIVPQFRKQFFVPKTIKSATAFITARGLYEAHINGKRVGEAYLQPGWTSYNKRLLYQTYDVTEHLKKGENAIGVILGNGWYRGGLSGKEETNIYGSQTALLFLLKITYTDGTSENIISDNTWKVTQSPIIMSEIYDGEIYDARLKKEGWSSPGFDEQGWSPCVTMDFPKNNLSASSHELIKKHESLKPKKVLTTPDGRRVIDFGQNLVGWVQVKVSGKAGEQIKLSHAEVLDKHGNPYFDNLRNASAQDIYVLSGRGDETLEPHFTFHGFRYVLIEGWDGPLDPDNFTAFVLHSAIRPTGSFECSNALVNQLQRNIQWGQKGNFLDVPTDCPQRDERLGWTGDAQVFFRTAAYNFDVYNFFAKWLRDVSADQFENGAIPFVIPDIFRGSLGGKTGTAGWSDAGIIIPWNMYIVYGDKRVVEEQYPGMKAYVEYIRHQAKDNLWNTGFQFADWLSYRVDESTEPNGQRSAITNDYLVAQCFYAYSVSIMIKAAALTGHSDDVAEYEALLPKIKSAFQHEYMTASGRLISDTQTAYVLALQFDMLPQHLRKQAADRLVRNIQRYDYHLTTGFLGTPFLNHVLSSIGRTDIAYKLLLQETYPSWLYPIKMGATTIWERWDSQRPDSTFQDPDMTSFNHYAYGAIGDWMYRVIGGVDTYEDGPGYKHIRIKPEIGGGFTYATAALDTYYGKVISAWRSEEGKLQMTVQIPVNTKATVYVPAANINSVTEGGHTLKDVAIRVIGAEDNYVILELGSGSYSFSVRQTR